MRVGIQFQNVSSLAIMYVLWPIQLWELFSIIIICSSDYYKMSTYVIVIYIIIVERCIQYYTVTFLLSTR